MSLRKLLLSVPKLRQGAQISTTANRFSCNDKKCPMIKVAGCASRYRFDCEPVKKRRCKCIRIDVPEPSFSECLRCPPPVHRMTECPDCSIRGLKPPKHCLKPKLGITIDGCNPRDSIQMLGSCRPRNVACQKVNKPCEYVSPGQVMCDPCIQPFKSYAPCNPPPKRVEKPACYAPKQDCGADQPTCRATRPTYQAQPDCPTRPTCPVQLPDRSCIDPDANCIDPLRACNAPDPACEMRNPCMSEDTPTCCSKAVCNFRSEPRKRDAAMATCRSCEEHNSGMYSEAPPKCPICGERMDTCAKKASVLDSIWNLVSQKENRH